MKTNIIPILLVVLLGACGEGKWGGELHLSVRGTATQGALAPGDTLTLAGGEWSLTLDRACLSVEMAVITPAAEAGDAGSDCFCHGDPPECHGDCSAEATDSTGSDIVAELDTVVDLLAGLSTILSRGAPPGDYAKLKLVLGRTRGNAELPIPCAFMEERTLWVQGTLTNMATAQSWTLTVDLRAEAVTEPMTATPLATATTDKPAYLWTGLRLDLALDQVSYATVTADATGEVTIGGDPGQNTEAAEVILQGLSHSESYSIVGR